MQDALRYENGRSICGSSIIVEWAKGPRRGVSNYADDNARSTFVKILLSSYAAAVESHDNI